MKNIAELRKTLPIIYNNRKLRMVSFNDIDWYITNTLQPYYEEYIDCKFSSVPRKKLEMQLYNRIKGYVCRVKNSDEARLLLCDCNTNEIIGGITLFEKDENIEIAYFILPKHQGKNEAYNMLKNSINKLNKSNMKFKNITAVIREDNTKSIKLIEKLGFRRIDSVKGKYKNNIVYIKEREYKVET